MEEIRKTVGENIKNVCALKGIRQIDISEHMGVPQGAVSNWIKGINSIIENPAELCASLGVSLDQVSGVSLITPEVILSKKETNLLRMFHARNQNGRDLIMNTARAFIGNQDMQKE